MGVNRIWTSCLPSLQPVLGEGPGSAIGSQEIGLLHNPDPSPAVTGSLSVPWDKGRNTVKLGWPFITDLLLWKRGWSATWRSEDNLKEERKVSPLLPPCGIQTQKSGWQLGSQCPRD